MTGVYISVSYDRYSKLILKDLQGWMGVPNKVQPEDLHSTIVYSRNDFDAGFNSKKIKLKGTITDVQIWKDNDKNVLVAILDSDDFRTEHEKFRTMGASNDYKEYIPHITLSYDVKDWKINSDHLRFNVFTELMKVSELDTEWTKG